MFCKILQCFSSIKPSLSVPLTLSGHLARRSYCLRLLGMNFKRGGHFIICRLLNKNFGLILLFLIGRSELTISFYNFGMLNKWLYDVANQVYQNFVLYSTAPQVKKNIFSWINNNCTDVANPNCIIGFLSIKLITVESFKEWCVNLVGCQIICSWKWTRLLFRVLPSHFHLGELSNKICGKRWDIAQTREWGGQTWIFSNLLHKSDSQIFQFYPRKQVNRDIFGQNWKWKKFYSYILNKLGNYLLKYKLTQAVLWNRQISQIM